MLRLTQELEGTRRNPQEADLKRIKGSISSLAMQPKGAAAAGRLQEIQGKLGQIRGRKTSRGLLHTTM